MIKDLDLDVGIRFLVDRALVCNNLDTDYSNLSLGNVAFQYFNEAKKTISFSYGLKKTNNDILDSNLFFDLETYELVLFLYLKVLNRIPSKKEINTLGGCLERKEISKMDALRSFAYSEEAKLSGKKVIFPEYELDDFLNFYDREFVENCYVYILKRYPKDSEKSDVDRYVKQLRRREIDRYDVLFCFLNLEEYKNSNNPCKIAGFEEAYASYHNSKKKFNLPVIGKLLRKISNILNSNRDLKIEAQKLYGISDCCVKNRDFYDYKKIFNELWTQVSSLSSKMDSISNMLSDMEKQIGALEEKSREQTVAIGYLEKEIDNLRFEREFSRKSKSIL